LKKNHFSINFFKYNEKKQEGCNHVLYCNVMLVDSSDDGD